MKQETKNLIIDLENAYEEQFGYRKVRLSESVVGIDLFDKDIEPIYEMGFINGMRFILARANGFKGSDCGYLTDEELRTIVLD